MSEFNSLEKIILDFLLRSQDIAVEDLCEVNNFNPGDIFAALKHLEEKKLIQIEENWRVRRSAEFVKQLVALRYQIFNRSFEWKERNDSA